MPSPDLPAPANNLPVAGAGLSLELTERVTDALHHAVAPNTALAYQAGVAAFTAWCASHDLEPHPTAELCAAWLADAATQRDTTGRPRWKATTLATYSAGVGQWAETLGMPNPRHHQLVRRTLGGVQRSDTSMRRTKQPLLHDDIATLCDRMDFTTWPAAVKATRDAAALWVGLTIAARRSELTGINLGDITRPPHPGHPGAVHVLIRRSKTDQTGEGHTRYVPPFSGDATRCPVCAMWRWTRMLAAADAGLGRDELMRQVLTDNRRIHICHNDNLPHLPRRDPDADPTDVWQASELPWLRPVTAHGTITTRWNLPTSTAPAGRSRTQRPDGPARLRLSNQALYAMLRERAADAGFNPRMIGGHSLRAGFITDASARGANLDQIATQSGHVSMTQLRGYVRHAHPHTNNAASLFTDPPTTHPK